MYLLYWLFLNSLTSDNIVILAGGSNPQSQRAANNTFIIAIRSESAGFEETHHRKSNCKMQKKNIQFIVRHAKLSQAKPSHSTPLHSTPFHTTPHHTTHHSTPPHPITSNTALTLLLHTFESNENFTSTSKVV